jgi:hypothetical protein
VTGGAFCNFSVSQKVTAGGGLSRDDVCILKVYTFAFMKNLSLKLDDDLFVETEALLADIKRSRNRYINEAVAFYNRVQRRKLLEKQLGAESALVADDSMEMLSVLEEMDDEG